MNKRDEDEILFVAWDQQGIRRGNTADQKAKLTLETIHVEDGVFPCQILLLQRTLNGSPLGIIRSDDGESFVLVVSFDKCDDGLDFLFVLGFTLSDPCV